MTLLEESLGWVRTSLGRVISLTVVERGREERQTFMWRIDVSVSFGKALEGGAF